MKSIIIVAAFIVTAPAHAAQSTENQAVARPPLTTSAIETFSIGQLSAAMSEGETTSAAITRAYLDRIAAIDRAGPAINSVIALNPDAMVAAAALDGERKLGLVRGPLHGIPVLLKDNIETLDTMATTAGSLALKDSVTRRDAPLVARLRLAGAVILGKTNLSEWANIRSDNSTSGWSAVGGLTKNPYRLDRNTCGSSAGSGAAMAAGLAAATIGTETDGSIVCPSSINGIVGFKPTVGLVSRRFVVPISHTQDTAGPMTATVRDAAMILNAIAGSDPGDTATIEADARRMDYTQGLTDRGLQGLRIGVVEQKSAAPALVTAAIKRLESAGATVIRIKVNTKNDVALGTAELKILLVELKADLAAYLAALPPGLTPLKTLGDVIAFNKANAATELTHFDQGLFDQAEAQGGLSDVEYVAALATARRLAGAEGIDKILADNKIDLIAGQTNGVAWLTTLGKGDKFNPPSLSQLPAVAGYPHLTLPMGMVEGSPVGWSFIGPKWSDALVLRAGHAFEIAGELLRTLPRFLPGGSQ